MLQTISEEEVNTFILWNSAIQRFLNDRLDFLSRPTKCFFLHPNRTIKINVHLVAKYVAYAAKIHVADQGMKPPPNLHVSINMLSV